MKNLDELLVAKDQYDKESQDVIYRLNLARGEIDTINQMKQTEGWKILDKRLREELHEQIFLLVKDDAKIQTLLALLKVADTKTMSQILEEEIKSIPE